MAHCLLNRRYRLLQDASWSRRKATFGGDMKVLIVDDNAIFAFIIQEMLESEGFETRVATNARRGYWAYLLFNPDLVITDLQMEGQDGFELMSEIRVHNPCVSTIYMSADASPYRASLEEEKKRHQASFLEKPFSKTELMRMIVESLG